MSEANAEDKATADTPPAVAEEKEEIKMVEPAATGAAAATEEEAEMPAGETTSEEAAAGEATSEAAAPAASEEEKKEDNNNNKQEEKSTDVDSSEVLKLEDAPIDDEDNVKPTTTESSGESATTTDADAAAAAAEEEEATPRNSAATTLTIASDAGPAPEEGMVHSFQPGDHVIRWEMLPILWPIQVHGIVLEVSNQCVTICDFGLTAEMRHDDDEQKVEETIDESNKKGNQRLQEAWDTVKPPDNRKKERITVHIMTTQEEIKPWKKVHYGRGLFGMGGDGEKGEGEDGEGGPSTPKKSAVMKQKVGNWFRGVKQGIQTRREARAEARRNNQLLQQKQQEAEAEAARIEITTTSNEDDAPPSPRTSNPTCLKGDFAAYDKEDQNGGDGSKKENTEDATKENGEGLTTAPSDPSLNTQATDNSTHSNTSDKDNNKPPAKEKNKLPESDPPKLVLARARLLLQQGEKILPPYHPFKSNSECIAVFCKTGYWRTLQASVFLHSTAIGNAKSSMAMTLGVAASMPLLAPAIALVGAGLVGAPYVILNQSKETWQQETLRLNEEFWKQAPNEVFVECIEHWSDLLKEEKEEKKKQEEAAAVAEEEKKKQEEEAEKPSSQRLVSV